MILYTLIFMSEYSNNVVKLLSGKMYIHTYITTLLNLFKDEMLACSIISYSFEYLSIIATYWNMIKFYQMFSGDDVQM